MNTDNKQTLTLSEINKIRKQCVNFVKLAMRNDTFFNNSTDTDIVKEFKNAMCMNIVGSIDSMCKEKNLTYTDIDIDATVEHFAELEQKVADVVMQSKEQTEALTVKPKLKVVN
jgi:hypothetical protein